MDGFGSIQSIRIFCQGTTLNRGDPPVHENADMDVRAEAPVWESTILASNIPATAGVSYRWDFGDGTPFTSFNSSQTVGHTYQFCGAYLVRVEAVDSFGNHAIGRALVNVTHCADGWRVLIPAILY